MARKVTLQRTVPTRRTTTIPQADQGKPHQLGELRKKRKKVMETTNSSKSNNKAEDPELIIHQWVDE